MQSIRKTDALIKAVLFDLDGTLLDTADDLGAALNHVLAKANLPTVAPERYRPVASDGANGLLQLGFADKLPHFDALALREEFLAFYQQNIATHTRLYPGVRQLLTSLNQAGLPWGIVTNKPQALTQQLLPYYREFDQCRVLVGGDTLAQRKPHPAPLLFASAQLNITAEHCCYLGDAERDISAGNQAGMCSFVAQWGYIKAEDDVQSWCADFSLNSPLELLEFIF